MYAFDKDFGQRILLSYSKRVVAPKRRRANAYVPPLLQHFFFSSFIVTPPASRYLLRAVVTMPCHTHCMIRLDYMPLCSRLEDSKREMWLWEGCQG